MKSNERTAFKRPKHFNGRNASGQLGQSLFYGKKWELEKEEEVEVVSGRRG